MKSNDISTDGPVKPSKRDCAGCGLYMPCMRYCPASKFLCEGCAADPNNQRARIDNGDKAIICAETAEAWQKWLKKNPG